MDRTYDRNALLKNGGAPWPNCSSGPIHKERAGENGKIIVPSLDSPCTGRMANTPCPDMAASKGHVIALVVPIPVSCTQANAEHGSG